MRAACGVSPWINSENTEFFSRSNSASASRPSSRRYSYERVFGLFFYGRIHRSSFADGPFCRQADGLNEFLHQLSMTAEAGMSEQAALNSRHRLLDR